MKDIDPAIIARGLLDAAHRTYVDPRCDDCGASVEPRGRMGPFECDRCAATRRALSERDRREFMSQERPDRRVHVVKLPEGMK